MRTQLLGRHHEQLQSREADLLEEVGSLHIDAHGRKHNGEFLILLLLFTLCQHNGCVNTFPRPLPGLPVWTLRAT